ncbi:DUF2922 domain-containing protein [Enterococcus sp. HY326]|uniref:DUF2922 domain-containing protein n=1 Tax=Enterococcus sp. HY326 TaxID=2971265 RepID=UPI00223EB85F|nr:DUF2922 domain-containing protein [Enterococcus sp. HY326]
MRKLHLMFKNADGSKKTLIIHLCRQDLAPEFVKTMMEELIALKLFQRNGVQLCTEIIGAKYVEKKVTPLFDRLQFLKRRNGATSQQKLIAAELEEMPVTEKGEGKLSAALNTEIGEQAKLAAKPDTKDNNQKTKLLLADTENFLINTSHPRKALLCFSKRLSRLLRQSSDKFPNFLKREFPVISRRFSSWITPIVSSHFSIWITQMSGP